MDKREQIVRNGDDSEQGPVGKVANGVEASHQTKPVPSSWYTGSQVSLDGGCSRSADRLERLFREMGDRDQLAIFPPLLPPELDRIRELTLRGPLQGLLNWLPPPKITKPCAPLWNSIMLFFNVDSSVSTPADYLPTQIQDAKNWLDEGVNPANPTISEFMANYWCTLSGGKLAFGIDTPRDDQGDPLIPTIVSPGVTKQDKNIELCIEANAERIWQAAGELHLNGKRWIPSVVLIEQALHGIGAHFGGYNQTVGGVEYHIGDRHHMHFDLDWSDVGGVVTTARSIWGRMCHEYAHNFLEFDDLYQGAGATGYWDLHGDNSPAGGRMSEVSSHMKERIGWIEYKDVIEGPIAARRTLSLKPYTTSGEAFKVVPDPENTPTEFFLLEYRKSTGNEYWRPDGGLTDEGLFITHVNTRMVRNGNDLTNTILLREAPFFDPERADYSDNGATTWTSHKNFTGVLFPQPDNDSFTPTSAPNSDLYGHRPSGLSITEIRVEDSEVRFDLEIDNNPQIGWTLHGQERGLAGRFMDDPLGGTDQIFFRDDDNIALLVHRQAQWLVERKQHNWVGDWNLGADNYEVVGDFDGDGLDEIYVRSPNWAGVLKWIGDRFRSVTVQFDWILDWNLGGDNREIAGDFDGDGAAEIYIRSAHWAGILKLIGSQLQLQSIQHDWIDQWHLGAIDREYVGRFTQSDRDEILIVSDNWIGLLRWDDGDSKLHLESIQHDWVDQWNIGPDNWHFIGDFDGDGLSEIYIRSPRWAGVMKWEKDRFQLLWIVQDTVDHFNGNLDRTVSLSASNAPSWTGRFLADRDGVLHRWEGGVAVLHWLDREMNVRHFYESPWNRQWSLGGDDRFVIGRFIKGGPDPGNPAQTLISPNLDGVFVHSGSRTGNIGVHYLNVDKQDISLTWIQSAKLMKAR